MAANRLANRFDMKQRVERGESAKCDAVGRHEPRQSAVNDNDNSGDNSDTISEHNVSAIADTDANDANTEANTEANASQTKGAQMALKDCIQHSISDKSKKRIAGLVDEICDLSDIEKLLLYMQLPNGCPQDADPLKQRGAGNPFGKKADIEVAQTYTWIQSHLEEDSTVSLPKQEVYEEYKAFCDLNKFEPLCVADFGKAMKHVFPRVKPRRLGQRGNSKYCYSGLRKKLNIETPELPLLDTSAYNCYKNTRSADESGECLDESFAKRGLSQDAIISAASSLILEWADKLLNCKFESVLDLGLYLINSSLVDDRSVAALTLKSTDQHQMKSHSKPSHSKRRDVQNQLQRKLQEKEALKEQKKKLELTKSSDISKSISNLTNNSKSIKKNKRISATNASKSSDESDYSAIIPLNSIAVKKEPEAELSSAFQANHQLIQQQTRIQNKLPIPRTGTPSRISQPAISTTSIILVPTAAVRLASPQSSITTECQSTSTTMSAMATSPLKSATSKYKRIQPKPVNISRSDSESAVSVCNSIDSCIAETLNSTSKRRHSVSVPIRVESAIKLKSESCFNDKQSQVKRQIEERESSLSISTKKRHVDSNNSLILMNNNNTNSSGFDDQNSSNSLSPISQELQTITSNGGSMGTSDIRIQEIETEAFMDYFSSNSMTNKDQWDVCNNNASNNSNNKSAQLSQLRKLLEKNLPNVMNNKAMQKHDTVQQREGYSELREALLRKNLNISVHTFDTLKTPNETNLDTSLSLNLLKDGIDFSKCRQIDGLVTSPVLDSVHCISSAPKSSFPGVDYFTNANALFNESSTLCHNVQVQVPSVPPSPNARRRAFNFQPISPRNTPTIPENSSIDISVYNNNYNNTMNSPPQYRMNQQTIGVGPSQPSSEANSPFVSPRSTPVPLSRSRHNSGQSNYSALRQTPLQSFDSGVSSISSSPFISPQSTPVPISRVRTGTGGMQRNFARARHSSGPGGPCNMSQAAATLLCHRSNSLSPMIGDSFLRDGPNLNQSLVLNELHSQIGSKSATPVLPLSPSAVLQQSEVMPLSADYVFNCDSEVLQSEWQPPSKVKTGLTCSLANRHRHSSNPYTSPSSASIIQNSVNSMDQFSQEIFSYMKNCAHESCETNSINKSVVNRCQSVPVHQMIQSNAPQISANTVKCENNFNDESSCISKSYPATPICNQNFQFPPSPPSSTKLQSVINGDDIISGNVSGQDVMVSGVQLGESASWDTNGNRFGNTQQADNDLIAINVNGISSSSTARRNLNDLLAEPPDDLQTTLEDLRDCDNDFSKFAQELEASSYDDLS